MNIQELIAAIVRLNGVDISTVIEVRLSDDVIASPSRMLSQCFHIEALRSDNGIAYLEIS